MQLNLKYNSIVIPADSSDFNLAINTQILTITNELKKII
jgi:hypothetical protein